MALPSDVELLIGADRKDVFDLVDGVFSFEDMLAFVNCNYRTNKRPSTILNDSWKWACQDADARIKYHPLIGGDEESLSFSLVVNQEEGAHHLLLVRRPDNGDEAQVEARAPWILKGVYSQDDQEKEALIPANPQSVWPLAPIDDWQLIQLAKMAAPEDWTVLDSPSGRGKTNYLLSNYIEYTYARLKDEHKILANQEDKKELMAFNTGLASSDFRDIIALCKRGNDAHDGVPQWRITAFIVAGNKSNSEKEIIKTFGSLPEKAQYFKSIKDIVLEEGEYDGTLSEKHIFLERIYRFPVAFLKKTEVLGSSRKCLAIISEAEAVADDDARRETILKRLMPMVAEDNELQQTLKRPFKEALRISMRRAARNYTNIVPCYFFERRQMELMLPICLVEFGVPDLALILHREKNGQVIGKTIYPISYAYSAARLVMRPDESWIHKAAERLRKGIGREGIEHYVRKTNPLRKGSEFARISGPGVTRTVKNGFNIGVYRDDNKPKPDIELPNNEEEYGSDYCFVSQLHGVFTFENSRWFFTDNNSTNGTILVKQNGLVLGVSKHQKVELSHDDFLILGDSPALRFTCATAISNEFD